MVWIVASGIAGRMWHDACIDMPLVDQFLEYTFLERESLAPAKMPLSP
ncbi:MAG: hypothetical protein V4512_12820 [Pseudomonadota bacterium]